MITVPLSPLPLQIHGVSLVCRRDRRFLLVRRGKEPWKDWLAFPGGSVEAGETAEEAALRELKEETALDAGSLAHLITVDLALEGKAYEKSYYLSVFRAFDLSGIEQAGDDAVSIHWLTIEEMAKVNVTESTLDVARCVAEREDGP
ncbi:DNA mismatch repair protein MutT [Falsochrobactrum shanghaiense]|uniref:DNA mismatch repair protein MutT n=1 Tax=Falsochrobactrum shanghaiense TaxID=2201899 RepID=A0A316J8I8_9HYPH|nr:NUDIX domain-containing protein [Falsochrobactrum shanghaiense]PWL18272.1 DNA mismatch repair protein MutT [Falsochrobactrum shanghaiense]